MWQVCVQADGDLILCSIHFDKAFYKTHGILLLPLTHTEDCRTRGRELFKEWRDGISCVFVLFCFFWWYWGLNLGPCAWYASTLPLNHMPSLTFPSCTQLKRGISGKYLGSQLQHWLFPSRCPDGSHQLV